MTSTSSSPPARARNPILVTLDVIAGIAFIGIGIVLGLYVIVSAYSYGGLHAECGVGPFEGSTCNAVVLGAAVYGIIAVAVIAWFLGLGFFVVSLIRKRYAFWWPLGAIVVTVVAFYIGTWVAGTTLP